MRCRGPAHPTLRDLLHFLRGELAMAENRRIVRHLLTGCSRCLAVTRPYWELRPGRRAKEGGRVVRR
jgi:hypothetical protein